MLIPVALGCLWQGRGVPRSSSLLLGARTGSPVWVLLAHRAPYGAEQVWGVAEVAAVASGDLWVEFCCLEEARGRASHPNLRVLCLVGEEELTGAVPAPLCLRPEQT